MLDKTYIPKKYKSPAKAIKEHCIECMGGRGNGENVYKMVETCNDTRCALWDFRFGKNPHNSRTGKPKPHNTDNFETSPVEGADVSG